MPQTHELNDEEIEPNILEKLTIKRLEMPEQFEGHIKESDLDDLDRRDKKMLIAMSVFEQYQHWMIKALVDNNRHQRRLEAELIRQRIESKRIERSQLQINWQMVAAKWVALSIAAGIIAAFLRRLVEKLWR